MKIRKATRVLVGTLLLSATPLIAFAGAGGGTQGRPGGASDQATSAVPEPGALLLFAAGAVVVGAAIRYRRSS